jgi:hypothetical protein
MSVDPNAGCVSLARERVEDSPCKQLTPNQYEMLKLTDMKMEWDSEGWLTYVGVRGMPRVEPLCEIPREAITFSFYDQLETGKLVYSRNPENPAVLVFTPLMNEMRFTFYKQWNAQRFPLEVETRRIPAMAIPSHLQSTLSILHLISSRAKDGTSFSKHLVHSLSADIIRVPHDLQRTRQLWQARGYPVGEVRLPDGSMTTYFAYRTAHTMTVAFVDTEGLTDVNIHEVAEHLNIPVSTEEETLGAFNLSNRCILCGLPNISQFDITSVCEFCLRHASQIVFKPKLQAGE